MATKKKTSSKQALSTVGQEFTRDDLEEMDHPSLVLFARLNYNLDLSTASHPRDECIKMIMNANRRFKGNADMQVVEMGAKAEVPPGHVKIRVSPGNHNPNARPIVVGLNFKMASIPCNKDVILPNKWLPCLQDAIQEKYFVKRGVDGKEELVSAPEHSYPFSILERG